MSESKWINKGGFYALRVSTLGHRVTFEDLVEDDIVQVYIDEAYPLLSRFESNDEVLAPCFDVTRGHGLTERRVVHYTDRSTHRRLRVGVTVHQSVFSSLPHPFEKDPVPGFEEAFIIITPGKGLVEMEGIMGAIPIDEAVPVRGGDLVAVPMGWHRVVALPNADGEPWPMAYVWAFLSKRPEWEKDDDKCC